MFARLLRCSSLYISIWFHCQSVFFVVYVVVFCKCLAVAGCLSVCLYVCICCDIRRRLPPGSGCVKQKQGGGFGAHSWGYSQWGDPSFCALHPWIFVLTDRAKDNLIMYEATLTPEEKKHSVVDLTQENDFRSVGTDSAQCITPGGVIWHTGRKRLLLGRGKFSLQSIWPPPSAALDARFRIRACWECNEPD